MIEIARLQFVRDRRVALGLAAAVLASMPLALLASARADGFGRHALEATAAFWVLLGLPAFAVLFGGSVGAELASSPSRSAELLLPLAPERRALGGALGALAHLSWVGALVLLAAGAVALFIRSGGYDTAVWREMLCVGALPWAAGGMLVYMLLVSNLVAYVFRHGILGGLAGLLLGGATFASLAYGMALETFFPGVSFSWKAALIAALAVGGSAYALWALAPWAERKSRASAARLAALAVLAGAGAVGGVGAAALEGKLVLGSTRIVEDGWSLQDTIPEPEEGVLLQSVAGALYWATPDGARVRLPGPAGSKRVIGWPTTSAVRDASGRRWLLVSEGRLPGLANQLAVWEGAPREGFSLVARFSSPDWPRLVLHGREVLLESSRGLARIPAQGRQPVWEGFRLPPIGEWPAPPGRYYELSHDSRTAVIRNPWTVVKLDRVIGLQPVSVRLLAFDGKRLALRREGELLELDAATGEVLSAVPLAPRGGRFEMRVGRGGVFVHSDGELSFLTWSGERRRLGR